MVSVSVANLGLWTRRPGQIFLGFWVWLVVRPRGRATPPTYEDRERQREASSFPSPFLLYKSWLLVTLLEKSQAVSCAARGTFSCGIILQKEPKGKGITII